MSTTERVRLLAISGSLRQQSLNSMSLRALQIIAGADIQVCIFDEVALLPLFNPDLEDRQAPALQRLKRQIVAADALVLASPEYAHGISGVMKNLLDHLVSGEEFVDKAVALINTSPRASHGQLALREVLRTMSAQIVEQACIDIPLLGSAMGLEQVIEDQSVRAQMRVLLSTLANCKSAAARPTT